MSDVKITMRHGDGSGSVYDRLGEIVRLLHNTLRQIGADKMVSDVANEFPSARERLLHIGALTEKAANLVLSRVESVSPVQDSLASTAKHLEDQLNQAIAKSQVPDPLMEVFRTTLGFVSSVGDGCDITRGALQDMMVAQDFQDLTGQLIAKVVALLERTEKDVLVLLIDVAPAGAISPIKKEEIMAGPGAPGGVALEQAAVDDLLADLGF